MANLQTIYNELESMDEYSISNVMGFLNLMQENPNLSQLILEYSKTNDVSGLISLTTSIMIERGIID